MKKILFALSLILISSDIISQVTIAGQIKNLPDSSELKITCYNNNFEFEEITLGKIKPDKEGKFSLNFNFNMHSVARLTVAEQYTNMYLVPGDNLYVTTDYNRFDSSLHYTGNGAADNNYMAAEMLANFDMQASRHRPFNDAGKFAAFIDSLERENQLFFGAHDSREFTPQFRNHILANNKYSFIYPRCMYMVLYDEVTNTIKERPVPDNYLDFLKRINTDDQQAAENLNYERALSNNYIYELHYKNIEKEIPEGLPKSEKAKLITTKGYELRKRLFKGRILDYQLTEFIKDNIIYARTDLKFMKTFIEDYKTICKNTEYMAIVDRAYEKASKLEAGQPAPDFTLINMDGQQVSLSSLKGKVVYIDFWATWCGPCMMEMPRSHELTEKFKTRNDIIFLYVNVDDGKDEWMQYLGKKKMTGVNLFATADQSTQLRKAYNFNGIPHYVLIDKNGNLISSNAERPGSVEKDILEALK